MSCLTLKAVDAPISIRVLVLNDPPAWPHLTGRIRFVEARVERATPTPDTLLVSVHACGGLTDLVFDMAVAGSAPVAVVPCCHARGGWEDAAGLERRLGVGMVRQPNHLNS